MLLQQSLNALNEFRHSSLPSPARQLRQAIEILHLIFQSTATDAVVATILGGQDAVPTDPQSLVEGEGSHSHREVLAAVATAAVATFAKMLEGAADTREEGLPVDVEETHAPLVLSPISPDLPKRKRGRPKKTMPEGEAGLPKRKRGRPKKAMPEGEARLPKRKRGRPKKATLVGEVALTPYKEGGDGEPPAKGASPESNAGQVHRRKRGRPKKSEKAPPPGVWSDFGILRLGFLRV